MKQMNIAKTDKDSVEDYEVFFVRLAKAIFGVEEEFENSEGDDIRECDSERSFK